MNGPAAAWREAVLQSPLYLMLGNGEDERLWEQHSATYVRNRRAGEHFQRTVNWLTEQLPPSASVIEIGPGPGIFTRFLAEHCAAVTAVEPSPANAAWLRQELASCRNLSVVQEKWEDAAVEPHDAVFCAGTLYVFPDIEDALLKMLRHAYAKVLLVTTDDEQQLEKEAAAALELPFSSHAPLTDILKEVLRQMNLPFTCASFSEETEYSYPSLEVLAGLWKGTLGLTQERLPDVRDFLRRRALLAEDAVRLPKRFTVHLIEITL